MKIFAFALFLLAIAIPAQAQNLRQSQFLWYSEIAAYDNYGYVGYGYRPFFPTYRYQMYVPQQTFYPMNWGAIPGYNTNGYFVPGVYGW